MLIRTIDELEALPIGAVVLTSDGVANQLNRTTDGLIKPHLAGNRYWSRTDATYLPEIIPDRLLPAQLIYPRQYGDEDFQHAEKAVKDTWQMTVCTGDDYGTWPSVARTTPDELEKM